MNINVSSAAEASAYAAQLFSRWHGKPAAITPIPNSRNYLFKLTPKDGAQYVVKIYAKTNELVANCEGIAYARLKGNGYVRQCHAMEKDASDGSPSYAILDYVDGHTLLDSLERLSAAPLLEKYAVGQIASFVKECMEIEVTGYGEIDSHFRGGFTTWLECMDVYLSRLGRSVECISVQSVKPLLTRGMMALQHFRSSQSTFLAERPSKFVPIDLNMSNFLLSTEDRLIALDLENFWAADPLLALGEWSGHTFGTSRYDEFIHAYGPLTALETAAVRFYALLSNVDVLMYIVNNQVSDPAAATPWGNPNRFVDLIASHCEWLGKGDERK